MGPRALRNLGVAGLVLPVALAWGSAPAAAAGVVNGNFESGSLAGWTVLTFGPSSSWMVEEPPMKPPFQGDFAAVSKQLMPEPQLAILSQEVTLDPNASAELRLAFAVRSQAPFLVPSTTEISPAGQEARVDVMKPGAPPNSTAPGDILETLYSSSEGENLEGAASKPTFGPVIVAADLSRFAGQTVELRFAVAADKGALNAYVGNVQIVSRSIAPPVAQPSAPPPPSNAFTRGTLKLDKKDGTGTLAVDVPGAGTLTALDLHSKVAVGSLSRRASKPPRNLVRVRTVSVTSGGAETVSLPIRPTKAGRKLLAHRGTLPISLKLIYTPTGGTAATQVSYGKLRKKLTKLTPLPR